MKRIYLVRHAESEHNAINNAFSGYSNIGISKKGAEDAELLKKYFEHLEIGEIYCSTLRRAKETSRIVFNDSISTVYVDDLREVNFGDYEGLYFDPNDYDDEIFHLWLTRPSMLTFPNGSNLILHAENYYKVIENIVKNSNADTIVIVSHSASIRLFIAKVLRLHIDYFRKIPCNNCSVTMLEYENEFKLLNCNLVYKGGCK